MNGYLGDGGNLRFSYYSANSTYGQPGLSGAGINQNKEYVPPYVVAYVNAGNQSSQGVISNGLMNWWGAAETSRQWLRSAGDGPSYHPTGKFQGLSVCSIRSYGGGGSIGDGWYQPGLEGSGRWLSGENEIPRIWNIAGSYNNTPGDLRSWCAPPQLYQQNPAYHPRLSRRWIN